MKQFLLIILLIIATKLAFSQNVTNVQVEQIGKKVHITYTLDKIADITLHLSTDGGVTYSEPLKQVTGDVGKNIPVGTHTIVWDVLAENDKLVGDNIVFKVKADPLIKTLTETVKGVTFEMVNVEGGTFMMGCTSEQGQDCSDNENPVHQVTISSYYIGKFEVTQSLWQAVMGSNPSNFKGSNLPVENVSWDDIQTFIRKLNSLTGHTYRLPTEAEWEYAARGGNKSNGYTYSGSNNLDQVAWYSDNSGSTTHSVGTKQPNELGIYDMSGNVWEWCQDWYGAYTSGSQTNPTGASSSSIRVLRGGSWYSNARSCRVSRRGSDDPGGRYINDGFRLFRVQ
jgi:formylglycine-generating enzyme required for sulfatase activity